MTYYVNYDGYFVNPEGPHNRAKELFIRHLSAAQYATFVKDNYIDVKTNKRHKYRIATNELYINIRRMDGWFISRRKFCIRLMDYNLPFYDHILAQKLLLEIDENRFLKTAISYY